MALKELYMRSGQGFVLVFSLTHLQSVNELGPLREQIVRIKDKKVSKTRKPMSPSFVVALAANSCACLP